ncbi:hypothetical protein D9M71_450750 [compost metagenome]
MAVDQHGDQPAVDQVGPAGVLGLRQMLGDDVDAVFVPVALDVQPVRVATAASVADTFRRGSILQRSDFHCPTFVRREKARLAFLPRELKPRCLEGRALLVFTADVVRQQAQEGGTMSEQSSNDRDSVVDARAAFILILLVVATAVFWVSHQ